MAMQIFEASGSFNPANNGLKVGDVIHVIAVGGGGQGDGSESTTCKDGGASSFGTYVTAKGGSKGGDGSIGAARGGMRVDTYGGGGGGGLMLGDLAKSFGVGCTALPASSTAPAFMATNGGGAGDGAKSCIPLYGGGLTKADEDGQRGAMNGGYGGYAGRGKTGGGGGAGYGAGGGGAAAASGYDGGNSGEYRIAAVRLTSTSAIAVTVGKGGAASDTSGRVGGAGADGVVIVFW